MTSASVVHSSERPRANGTVSTRTAYGALASHARSS